MIELQVGDVFGSRNPMRLGRAINFAQRIWSLDNESTYSHVGIITDMDGTTLEALWQVKEQNLFDSYAGQQVIIARPNASRLMRQYGINMILKLHKGDVYPVWRLLFHLIPPVAKYASAGGRFLVCSELTAKYLYFANVRPKPFVGVNPDNLVDEWKTHKGYEVIFEGTLPER